MAHFGILYPLDYHKPVTSVQRIRVRVGLVLTLMVKLELNLIQTLTPLQLKSGLYNPVGQDSEESKINQSALVVILICPVIISIITLKVHHYNYNFKLSETVLSLIVYIQICTIRTREQDAQVVNASALGSEGPRFDLRQQPLVQLSQRWLKQSHTSS